MSHTPSWRDLISFTQSVRWRASKVLSRPDLRQGCAHDKGPSTLGVSTGRWWERGAKKARRRKDLRLEDRVGQRKHTKFGERLKTI